MRWLFGAAILAVVPLLTTLSCAPEKPKGPPVSQFKSVLKDDIKVGTGEEAKDGDLVLIQYVGRFPKDGAMFDTNDPELSEKNKNPLPFEIGKPGVVEGINEGVKGMKEGGERKISVPWQKGYGAEGSEAIPAYSDLTFTVKLMAVVKHAELSTVEIEDMKVGTGPEIQSGMTGLFDYRAMYVNNRVFDDNYARKKPVVIKLGAENVISGLDKGVDGMKVGGKRKIRINPEAAWGIYGNSVIPGNQVLIFEIELLKILPNSTK